MGNWNFATRTVKIEFASAIDPDFGLQRAFTKPSDWVRTTQAASDEFFYNPLVDHEFKDEQGYWFANIDSIYVRYVSDDSSYGKDLSLWPQSFVLFFEGFMGWSIAPRLKADIADRDKLEERMLNRLKSSRSKDAVNEGIKFMPATGWSKARSGRRSGRRDLGRRDSLTG